MVRTDYTAPYLSARSPVDRVYMGAETNITANVYDTESGINRITLDYTRDDWKSSASINISHIQNGSYVLTIPGQSAGSLVKFRIKALDYVGNVAQVNGSYIVKDRTMITCTTSEEITIDKAIVASGSISPSIANLSIILTFTTPNGTIIERSVRSESDGTYSVSLRPELMGDWHVEARVVGDGLHYPSESQTVAFRVVDTWISRNKTFILAACVGGGGSVGAFFFIRRRRQEEDYEE
jgi:hypothetical protein